MKTRNQYTPPSEDQRIPPSARGMDIDDLVTLAHSVNQLQHRIASDCAPLVRKMIRNGTRDPRQIEAMLDRLLDCACIPEGLVLLRSLCRHYFPINPSATASYILAYREMWDSNDPGKEDAE